MKSLRRNDLQLNSLPDSGYTPGTIREHRFPICLSIESIGVAPPPCEKSFYHLDKMKIAKRSYP